MEKILIALPAYNEDKVIGQVLQKLKNKIKKFKRQKITIIVIDDCSTDKTSIIAKKNQIKVLRHPMNRGLGGALATAFYYAKINNFDILVTMDSDGQHDPEDLDAGLQSIFEKKADMVIGIRDINKMPFDRKIITFLSSILTFLLFGIWCDDTQSGFRFFNRKAIRAINLKTQKMEVSSEFFTEIRKHQLKFIPIPIRVIYTDYSRQKGQSNLNSANILVKLLLRLAR